MRDNKKYIFAFLITAAIFGTAVYASNYFSNKRIVEVRDVENQLSLDILSSETQSALLEETSCSDINNTFLSQELGQLQDKLTYAASENSPDNAQIENLKETYALLEIKDYLLMKSITAKCRVQPTFILYFYSDADNCPDCEKTGYVLDALREKYPTLRIYSFDYNMDQTAVKTLISIYHVKPTLPALIINGEPYYGFKSLDTLEKNVPALAKLKAAYDASSTSATTTPED